MSSGIPLDSNFKNLSCQLGGLRLNGQVAYSPTVPAITGGTAESLTVITIDDSSVIQNPPPVPFGGTLKGYLRVKIGNTGVDVKRLVLPSSLSVIHGFINNTNFFFMKNCIMLNTIIPIKLLAIVHISIDIIYLVTLSVIVLVLS